MTPALHDGQRAWSRQAVEAQTQALAHHLDAWGVRVLASVLDNTPAWVVADLACRQQGCAHLPLPLFFTPQQVAHALASTAADAWLLPATAARALAAAATADAAPVPASLASLPVTVAGEALVLLRLAPAIATTQGTSTPSTSAAPAVLPEHTAKITFTSGTTGTPKGVCLGAAGLDQVARSVAATLAPLGITRHLCALPLAVLLEDVAGLHAATAAGAQVLLRPLTQLGWGGSSQLDIARFHQAVQDAAPHSLMLLPQMLAAWVAHLQAGARTPRSLAFVAVGGAAVGAGLIQRARAQGLPVYEGYGLSEAGSVQTLNRPGLDRPGSVGRPLPHAHLRVAADGEIEVHGALMLGYVGSTVSPPSWWPTGDLGEIDAQGYLHVRGRKKNVLITSYGRNVSPEWVEARLCEQAGVAHAVVLGDGQAALWAVLWPAAPGTPDAALDAAVATANAGLPDYARLAQWVRAQAPLDAARGLATANGRPRREAIQALHAPLLTHPELHA